MLEFWALAAAFAVMTALLLIRPLLTAGGTGISRATHDVAVFRDQLKAVERDLERGVLSPAEADGARAEVSRRLLAAASEEESTSGAAPAPARVSRMLALSLAGVVAVAGGGLYLAIGSPGAPDLPLKPRLEALREAAANRPGQEAAERDTASARAAGIGETNPDVQRMRDLVTQLRQVLAERPDDLRGRRLLVDALLRLDDTAAAWRAQREVIALLGPDVTARDHAMAGEAMILAAGGYVSPEAEVQLSEALRLDPADTTARYYAGLSLGQNGRADLTLDLWTKLLGEGPADAPWKQPILSMIEGVAEDAGKPVPPEAQTAVEALRALRAAPGSGPGPDAGAVRAAQDMTPADRRAMIEGMVAQLEDRLATEGGAPEDWARLINAYGVLGRGDDVARVAGSAKEAFAQAPDALAMIDAAAAQATDAATAGGALPPAAPATPATATAPALPGPALPGPDADAVRAAGDMTPAERQEMIAGMVAQLADRLAADGGTADEWVRLIRAYGVTGRMDDAARARDAALAAHPDARDQLFAAALAAGLPPESPK
jgi:cytochrome c-type biogenesis protein CcmH